MYDTVFLACFYDQSEDVYTCFNNMRIPRYKIIVPRAYIHIVICIQKWYIIKATNANEKKKNFRLKNPTSFH